MVPSTAKALDRARARGFGQDSPMTATPTDPSALDEPKLERGSRGELGGPRGVSWPRELAELLLTGGMTLLLYPLSWVFRKTAGLDAAEYAVGFTMFHAAHVINDPHFAVTYSLFYEEAKGRALGGVFSRAQRIRYVLAGFVAPAALVGWAVFALATKSAPRLGVLINLMFLLVGFHYVKQGFGLMTVLSARRGVFYSPRERLVLLSHALAGWLYAWANPADLGTVVEEKGVVFTTWARTALFERCALVALVASGLALAVMLVRKWRREGRLPIAAPLVAFLCSIWAWSIYSGIDPLVRYVNPALHSIQYLFMVRLLKGNEGAEKEGPPFFERSKKARLGLLAATALGLGFVLFHGAPQALDAILVSKKERFTDLGATPYFAAIYAVVNLHHYFMDMVIWRKENPKTRYLRDA